MAPKRGTKRAAQTQPEDGPADKKLCEFLKTQGVSRTMYKAIAEGLEHPLLVLPDECRKMLVSMIPKSLCVPSDERHELQRQCVDMLGEAILEVKAKMQEAIDAEQSKVASVESAKSELQGKLQQAKDVLAQKQENLKTSEHILSEASKAVLAAKAALAASIDDKSAFDSSCAQVRLEKETFEGVINNDLKQLRDGTWVDGEAQKHFDAVAALFGKFALEESLLAVLPGSLMRKTADRGSFDHMAVQQLDESIHGKLRELTADVDKQAPHLNKLEGAVASAQIVFDETSEEQKRTAGAMGLAQEEEKTAITALKAAEMALEAGEADFRKASEVRDLKQSEFDAFEYNIGSFKQLKERESLKKVQEVSEEAAEAQPAAGGA